MSMQRFLMLVLLPVLLVVAPAHAQIEVDINKGHLNPLPVAVDPFMGDTPEAADLGADIAGVVTNNLERSGLFEPISQEAFVEDIQDFNVRPRFQDWRLINAQALLTGEVELQSESRMRVAFRLWDVYGEEEILALSFTATPDLWRRIAHKVSDQIYKRLTGEEGYFDTRIVFVSESGDKMNRVKRLAIMDQDGANMQFLTSGDYTVLTPRFSPSNQMITYMSYRTGKPQIHLFDIETGRHETLGNIGNMTFAPRFSPDGSKVVMSLEEAGNTDIYVMDLRSRQMTRLTFGQSIDTSPTFSPEGDRVVFESDRGGSQQLYIMNADGSGVERISFGEGRYATPVWSPRGDLIAFTKITGGRFAIGVMRSDGSGERLLADGFRAEGPTWAPNGRVIMFWREERGGEPSIWSIDLTGQNLRRVNTPGSASDPAWSPLLD
ncbi:Tol-Pal system beta propeller repeat protein TolB [Euryhalocaulis caribicus]|uniref:Tol-Pal system beta propeller repeat protein TolB n=1 Tax=Euryhalocaulis caribicus TaxID=1161401 RepID=UPI00039B9D92